jgi:hypothetical protein
MVNLQTPLIMLKVSSDDIIKARRRRYDSKEVKRED